MTTLAIDFRSSLFLSNDKSVFLCCLKLISVSPVSKFLSSLESSKVNVFMVSCNRIAVFVYRTVCVFAGKLPYISLAFMLRSVSPQSQEIRILKKYKGLPPPRPVISIFKCMGSLITTNLSLG